MKTYTRIIICQKLGYILLTPIYDGDKEYQLIPTIGPTTVFTTLIDSLYPCFILPAICPKKENVNFAGDEPTA